MEFLMINDLTDLGMYKYDFFSISLCSYNVFIVSY